MRYATICADPPWRYDDGWPSSMSAGARLLPKGTTVDHRRRARLPYPALDVAQIAALPVANYAAPNAHLYLWTTNRYLPDAFAVVAAWGFRYAQLLVWAKSPMGLGPGGAYVQNAEYILFARRGTLRAKQRIDSVWFNWKRTAQHSRKPEHFLDMVEQVSPGPYLELFSRRHRLGWDVWGDGVNASIPLLDQPQEQP